jgi:hypothetical protein
VRDTRAERISGDEGFNRLLEDAYVLEPLVLSLADSYSSAIANPENEFVHLYEIREALATYFHGEKAAEQQLGITAGQWKRLGSLTNDRPVRVSRHRGKHLISLRSATAAELAEARDIARMMIEAFAKFVLRS